MKNLRLLLLLAAPAFAAEPAITIYNQGFAVIRDTLPIDLKAGPNQITFAGATAKLEPDPNTNNREILPKSSSNPTATIPSPNPCSSRFSKANPSTSSAAKPTNPTRPSPQKSSAAAMSPEAPPSNPSSRSMANSNSLYPVNPSFHPSATKIFSSPPSLGKSTPPPSPR